MADHLLVIRSGATDYDLDGRIRGTLDVPLSPAGIAEAEAAATALACDPPTAVYVAAGPCTAETGRIISQRLGVRSRPLPGLDNLDLGLWQGMLVADLRRRQPRMARQWDDNPWTVVPPEGEPLDEACDRVGAVLERVLRRHPRGRVALVVPHPLDRIVRWVVAGETLADLWDRDPVATPVVALPLAAQWRPVLRHPQALPG